MADWNKWKAARKNPQSKSANRGALIAPLVGALMLVPLLGLTAGRAAEPAVEIPAPALDQTPPPGSGLQTIVLAGGCFWGMQAVFSHTKGVTQVDSTALTVSAQ